MKEQYTFDELLRKAASYCSKSEHCVSEVITKLNRWQANEADTQKIIKKLIDDDFINEKRYAAAFVRDKFRLNKWGKIKISVALRGKGIENDLIDDALEQIDEGEYRDVLTTLIKSKQKSIKYKSEYEKQGKLFRFALGRGFESNLIEQVLRDI